VTFDFTEQQQSAIDYEDSMVITACPGAGKTAVMVEKIKKATKTLKAHQGIIAITFTVKASEEIVQRSRGSSHSVSQSYFGTIDKFCLNEIIYPFISHIWGGTPSECRISKNFDENELALFETEYQTEFHEEWFLSEIDVFKNLYLSGKIVLKSVSSIALYILKTNPAAQQFIKARYTHIFVDEYQDSSEAQHLLFKTLVNSGLMGIAVGDTNQSIYKFRGSNPEYIRELVQDQQYEPFVIDINHRSHDSIKNYAARLLNANTPLLPTNECRMFRRFMNGNISDASATICDWIQDWKERGTINEYSDVAILAKKENSLKLFQSGAKLACRTYVDTPLDKLDSLSATLLTEVLAYIGGASNSYQEILEKYLYETGIRVSPERKRSTVELFRILRDISGPEEILATCKRIAEKLYLQCNEIEEQSVLDILSHQELFDLYTPKNNNELQLMTLHKSKGLEFEIVFHLDLEAWSFPHQKYTGNWNDPPQYSDLPQETNLHYVGITRAKEMCILIRCEKRMNSSGGFGNSSPSCFLGFPQLEGLYNFN